MKKSFVISILLIALSQASCGPSIKSSAIVPIDLSNEINISNGDFDLVIYDIVSIESKELRDSTISLKESAREKYNLYEILMHYTNLTDTETKLGSKLLNVSLPESEDPADDLSVVGYCEPLAEDPKGEALFCGYLSRATGGGFTTSLLQLGLIIQPGEQAKYSLIIVLAKNQPEIVISFVEPELESATESK